MTKRAAMDDGQFALAAREHLGAGSNAEAYDRLVSVVATALQRTEAAEAPSPDAVTDVEPE